MLEHKCESDKKKMIKHHHLPIYLFKKYQDHVIREKDIFQDTFGSLLLM